MSTQVLPLVCAMCRHEWTVPLRMPIPVDRFVTYTRGLVAGGCPACGATGAAVCLRVLEDAGRAAKVMR